MLNKIVKNETCHTSETAPETLMQGVPTQEQSLQTSNYAKHSESIY